MKKKINLNFEYPEFILPAINDQSHYVVVPAGRQTGKTYNFVQWILSETIENGCASLWVDTIHANIDKYIDRYFKVILGDVWELCDWNQQKKVLSLPGGGYIDFGSAQKPENLEGFNYKRCVLNEAGHILQKASLWDNTIMPMIKAEDNKTRIIGTPKGRNLFYDLYQRGLKGDGEYKSYKYTVYDSPFWTEQQAEAVRARTPDVVWKQEYMAGFESYVGLIYPDFDNIGHVKESDKDITDNYFLGLDVGWNHPTACILIKENTKHEIYVVDEFRESNLTTADITRSINGMLVRNGLTTDDIAMYVIDPASKGTQQTSGQSMLDQLREEGWGFVPGNNDVMSGINRITKLLRDNKLFVSKRCPQLIDEFGKYHWKEWNEDTDQSRNRAYKVGDDLMDALRYVVMSRPDYYEHQKLDMFGVPIKDNIDPNTGAEIEYDPYASSVENIDILGSSFTEDMF